jgi:O-antigen biosynthesis protein
MKIPNIFFWKQKKQDIRISVCTLVWDGLDFTRRFIDSLKDNKHISYELVIVDNGSLEETSAYLRQQTKNYFKFEQNQGFSKGFNKAVEMSGCEYVLLTNNDTVWPKEDWANELIFEYENLNNCGLLFPCANNILLGDNRRNSKGKKIFQCDRWKVPRCSGVAFFLKRDIFLAVGGFSEEFWVSGEDLDFQCKVWDTGYDIYVTEKVFVEHIGKATSQRLLNRKELWGQTYHKFKQKWKCRLK